MQTLKWINEHQKYDHNDEWTLIEIELIIKHFKLKRNMLLSQILKINVYDEW
jgi:hypothetical protein